MDGYIVMGNINAVCYKEIFPLIKEGKMLTGYNFNKAILFRISDSYEKYDTIENGVKYGKVPTCAWYTNIHIKKDKPLVLTKSYYENPELYPKYDNYDAINVDKIKDIPYDYEGVMGVPITILGYDLDDIEIKAAGNCKENFVATKEYINPKKVLKDGKIVNTVAANEVLTIESKEKPVNKTYYASDDVPYLVAPYVRVLVKKNFEIIWQASGYSHTNAPKEILEELKFNPDIKYIGGLGPGMLNGKATYSRILIRKISH